MKRETGIQLLAAILWLAMLPSVQAFYDPGAQRWINRDPIGEEGGDNLYGFVHNEPTRVIDDWGRAWKALPYQADTTTTSRSTVVCDGMGGIRVELAPAHKCMECGLTACMIAHENSHRADILRENPSICQGKRDGTAIGQTFNPTRWKSEIKAYNVAIGYARAMQATASADCMHIIQAFIWEAEGYRDEYQNELDAWRRWNSRGSTHRF